MITIKLVFIAVHEKIREKLRDIRDEILARTGEQIGFSDIIKHALDNVKDIIDLMAQKLANHKRNKIDKEKRQISLTDEDLEMIKG